MIHANPFTRTYKQLYTQHKMQTTSRNLKKPRFKQNTNCGQEL